MALEKKPIVLFVPQYLKDGFGFLSFLYVIKKPISVDFLKMQKIDVREEFDMLPDESISDLICLTDEMLAKQKADFQRALGKAGRGREIEEILHKKIIRSINDSFLHNINTWKRLPWYHQTKDPIKKSVRKGPCSFEDAKLNLLFTVVQDENEGLQLQKFVQIGKAIYNLNEFTRYLFLLEYKGQYFTLSNPDYLALDLLDTIKWDHIAFNPKEFFNQVVKKLESKGYTVNRNNCFQPVKINSSPTGKILISEISNAFLQFIPSYDYEGITIDGPFKEEVEVERLGEIYSITRDKQKETEIIDSIKTKHINFKTQFNNQFFIPFDEAKKNNWFLKVYQNWLDDGIEIIGLDLLEHFRYSSHKIETNFKWLSAENGLSTIDFKVQFGTEIIKIKELQKVIHSGQKSILLADNSIGVFPDEWLLQYAVFLKHAKVINDHTVHISNRLLQWLDTPEIENYRNQLIPKDWNLKWKQWQTAEEIDLYPISNRVKATLRPYQKKGYEWMCLLAELGAGACLADDMGLGKTLQTICFIAHQIDKYPKEKHLIICPASLVYNWKSEFEKFAPGIDVMVFRTGIEEFSDFFIQNTEVMICTYSAVRNYSDVMAAKKWTTIVIDESHNIKNPSAQITRAVQSLNSKAKAALSGTPVMNNTFDLYSQFEFLLPGFLGGQEFFRKEYADPIDKNGDNQKSKLLHKITAPYIMRRTKSQVAKDLPDKTVSVLWCEMEEKQRAIYQEVKSQIRNNVFINIKETGLQNSKIGVLAGIMKLKQICCSPTLIEEYQSDKEPNSTKLNVLMEELTNQLVSNKVLVFSQFKTMLYVIGKKLKKSGIPFYHLDGDTKIDHRLEMVNAFNSVEDPARVFLISLKAGNAGLNLTAADYVFLVDPWWNTSVEDQAIDRTHRIGQTKHVMAYKMICKDSIEERIMNLQKRKGATAQELVKEEDGHTKTFSDAEIDSLFVKSEDGFVKNLTEADVAYLFE